MKKIIKEDKFKILGLSPFILVVLLIILWLAWRFSAEQESKSKVLTNAQKQQSTFAISIPVLQTVVEGEGSGLGKITTPNTVSGAPLNTQENPSGTFTSTGSQSVINPTPSQEEMQSELKKHQETRARVEKAVAYRKSEIARVHNIIINSGVLNNNQVKPFVEPILIPPADVEEKIRSGKYLAH